MKVNIYFPNSPKNDTNKDNEVDIGPRQDQEKDSMTSSRTIPSKIALTRTLHRTPHTDKYCPHKNHKRVHGDIIDDIGLEESVSQISITLFPPEYKKIPTSNNITPTLPLD